MSKNELTAEILNDYVKESPLVWTLQYVRLPKGILWDFCDRAWQKQIFDDDSREMCVMKPTQIGISTLFLCKAFHFAEFNASRIMYVLPRRDDVSDFTTTKLDPIVKDSAHLSRLVGKTNSVRTKTFGRSFMHISEASVTPRMLDVDFLVRDEVDLCDQNNLAQYENRLDASIYGRNISCSTPTIFGWGIHAMIENSTHNRWYIRCPYCRYEFVLDWERDLKYSKTKAHYGCPRCDKGKDKGIRSEDIRNGRWIPEHPEKDVIGYTMSQMNTPWIPPFDLYTKFKNAKSVKLFYNLRLGMPYTPAVSSLTREEIITSCFTGEGRSETSASGGQYYMGVDQGNDLHILIAKIDGEKRKMVHAEVVPYETGAGFDRVSYLIERYKVKTCICDALPNRHSARNLVNEFSGRVTIAFYSEIKDRWAYNKEDKSHVNINKTENLDALRDAIIGGDWTLFGERASIPEELDVVINHMVNIKRDEEVRKTASGERVMGVWRSMGADHYANCWGYLNLAMDMNPARSFRFSSIRW